MSSADFEVMQRVLCGHIWANELYSNVIDEKMKHMSAIVVSEDIDEDDIPDDFSIAFALICKYPGICHENVHKMEWIISTSRLKEQNDQCLETS